MPDVLTIETDAELSILYHPSNSQPTTWQRVDYIGLCPLRRRQAHGYYGWFTFPVHSASASIFIQGSQSIWFTNMGIYVTSPETKGATSP